MANLSRFSKVSKSYRHDADVADLIKRTAKLANVSESAIVDACVRAQARAIVTERVMTRLLLRDKATAAALAAWFKK